MGNQKTTKKSLKPMKKVQIFLAIALLITTTIHCQQRLLNFESTSQNKCCVGQCPAGLSKVYSIDTKVNNCGEACMDLKWFPVFHIFESGLSKTTSLTPCADRGYTDYKGTPTHGALFLKITLDLYGPTKKELV